MRNGHTRGKDGKAVEKRRIRLEINGVVCGLITQESEEYMGSLAQEVGAMMRQILDASPYITREAAALTAALSCCDEAKKNGRKASSLQDRVEELEVEAELWQEEKEELLKSVVDSQKDARLQERAARLEAENTALAESAQRAKELEGEKAALEDENAALRESAAIGAKALQELSALREKLKALEEEQAQSVQKQEGGRLLQLEAEIEALQRQAQQAQQEKSAAQQAAEEAQGLAEALRQEALQAREEARRLRESASPALDALERQAEAAQAAPPPEQPAGAPTPAHGRKKRRNPLRYEEEFQQEGFVSFFEKP